MALGSLVAVALPKTEPTTGFLTLYMYSIMMATKSKYFLRKSPTALKRVSKRTINKEPENDPSVLEPPNWRSQYENISKIRSETPAAVDTMGCDQCSDPTADDRQRRFQLLVALMLSSQTRDQVTYAKMSELRQRGLSVEFINEISESDLADLLKPVGFYRRKAVYLKRTAEILRGDYQGDIPGTAEELMKLPGVGPKMAHLAMKSAWNQVTGIGVDTHVHRISNRLGWVKTKTPEETEKELSKWLPQERWNEVNHLLVGLGQTICLPVRPKCAECLNRDLCPSSTAKSSKKPKQIDF